VNVSAKAGVIREIPAYIVRVIVNDDVVGIPEPPGAIAEVISRHAEIEAVEEETGRAAAAEPVDMVSADRAAEATVGKRVIEVVMRIPAFMPDPVLVLIDVRSVGVSGLITEVRVRFPALGLLRCLPRSTLMGRRAVGRDVAAARRAVKSSSATTGSAAPAVPMLSQDSD